MENPQVCRIPRDVFFWHLPFTNARGSKKLIIGKLRLEPRTLDLKGQTTGLGA